jgi:hypothetical protein
MDRTQPSALPVPDASDTSRRSAFRPIIVLATLFLGVSAAMIVFLAGLVATRTNVDVAVWIRCSLVLGSAVLLLVFATRAANGSRSSWIRLRIVSPIVVVAVIVIVAIPGLLPGWVRVEQAVCGLLVLPIAILANIPRLGRLFPRRA